MGEYPSFVAGLRYEGRGRWCAHHLRRGDQLLFRLEPDNPVDEQAVVIVSTAGNAVIGHVPRKHHWIHDAIIRGETLDAIVSTMWCVGFLWWRHAWRIWIIVRTGHAATSQTARQTFRSFASRDQA